MNESGSTLLDLSRATPGVAPGRLLAQARELQNLSKADVARQLKLSLWQVEALEAGHYDRLPGLVFVRGFIRNYARLVKLDPEALLHLAGDNLPQPVPRPELPPSQDIPFPTTESRRGPIYTFGAVLVIGVLAFYEFYWNEPDTVVTRQAAVAPAAVDVTPQPEQPLAPSETGPASTSPVGEAQVSRPTTAAAASAPAPAARPDSPASAPRVPGSGDQSPAPGARQVRLEFDEESWVEIRDGTGRAIFSQLNLAGTVRRVQGVPPLSVVVGNAQGVKLTYDNRPVDLARHTKVDVARLTLE